MGVDMARIEILLQRRYNCLREIDRLTREMLETLSREDEVSLSLMLTMRAEEIESYQACQEEIWRNAEQGAEEAETVKRIMNTDPEEALQTAPKEERLIFEIRKKTVSLIRAVQQMDQELNRRAGAATNR